jgi:hypothetical protein
MPGRLDGAALRRCGEYFRRRRDLRLIPSGPHTTIGLGFWGAIDE